MTKMKIFASNQGSLKLNTAKFLNFWNYYFIKMPHNSQVKKTFLQCKILKNLKNKFLKNKYFLFCKRT